MNRLRTFQHWPWVLIVAGIAIVAFSDSIGVMLVTKMPIPVFSAGTNQIVATNYSWNTDAEKAISLRVKIVGGMIFLAGLIERIVGGAAGRSGRRES